jgi:UDP-glucose 4-epimerase
MERVLVTGGAGFIGANVSNILAARGYQVVAFDTLAMGKKENLRPEVQFVQGDAGLSEDLARVGAVDHVIHLAASSSAPMFLTELQRSLSNNILGHVGVLEFARAHNVKKVLFASTSSIYGNNPVPLEEGQRVTPPNFYAVSKHFQEEVSEVYSRSFGTEIIGFRLMSVYGLHEEHKGKYANMVSQFIWGMEKGKQPVMYGDGEQTRDFVNVRDVAEACLLALKTQKRFGYTVFNVGTGEAVSLRALCQTINKVMGTNISPRVIPNPVATGYIASQQADLTRIRRELGFAPTVSLENGIREIVEHRRTHPVEPVSLSY